jgi:hypothetical protein
MCNDFMYTLPVWKMSCIDLEKALLQAFFHLIPNILLIWLQTHNQQRSRLFLLSVNLALISKIVV